MADVAPADARAFLADFVPDPKGLETMADPDVLAYHGRVVGALDKHRPAPGDWREGLDDTLKPVVKDYSSPVDAIKALHAQADWKAGIADEAMKKAIGEAKTPAEAIKVVMDAKGVAWRDAIQNPDLKKFVETFATVEDLAKAGLDYRQKISKGLKAPGADAKPEEIAEYRKARGVPDDIKAYEFKFPDGLPEGLQLTDEMNGRMDKFRTAAQALGLTPQEAQGVVHWFMSDLAEGVKDLQGQREAAIAKGKEELARLWGGDLEANTGHVQRFVREFGSVELVDKLGDILGGVEVANMLANAGRRMAEAPNAGVSLDEGQLGDLRQQLEDLTAKIDDAYRNGRMAEVEKLADQRSEVARKISGDRPLTGIAA